MSTNIVDIRASETDKTDIRNKSDISDICHKQSCPHADMPLVFVGAWCYAESMIISGTAPINSLHRGDRFALPGTQTVYIADRDARNGGGLTSVDYTVEGTSIQATLYKAGLTYVTLV